VYFGILLRLALRKEHRGFAPSLAIATATMVAGAWGIMQSRGSTAGIGFIFLPMWAAGAGGTALWAARLGQQPGPHTRLISAAILAASLVPAASSVVVGVREGTKNTASDAAQAERDRRTQEARAWLDRELGTAGSATTDTLDRLIRARRTDREFLIAALDRDGVSAALLDTLAGSPDMGIALHAVRNRGASSGTLERVYRTGRPAGYFHDALAGHPNTPTDVLRAIRSGASHDIWLAENPALPSDLLQQIARTSMDVHVLRVLLRRRSLDCALLTDVASGALMSRSPDEGLATHLSQLRGVHCP